jgi:hypothetical protein
MGRSKILELANITADQIKEMVTTMDCKSLPEEVVEYMRLMEKARDWHYQMKSRLYVVKHLKAEYFMQKGEELTDYYARQVYDNAINYYYADRRIRKEAWRNMLAEKYMLAGQLCFDRNEYAEYRKQMEGVERMMRLNEKDDEGIDAKLLDRRPHVYVVTSEELGIPHVSRTALGKLIDGYDIRENERAKIKREAGVSPRRLLEVQDAEVVND